MSQPEHRPGTNAGSHRHRAGRVKGIAMLVTSTRRAGRRPGLSGLSPLLLVPAGLHYLLSAPGWPTRPP